MILKYFCSIRLLAALLLVIPAFGQALTSGSSETGTLSSSSDTQTHSFTANAGESVVIGISGGGTNGAWLYSPSGVLLGTTVSFAKTFNSLPESGAYSVIAHRRHSGGTPASYTLHFVKVPGTSEYGFITSGSEESGNISSHGDLESYSFTASAGDSVVIGISGGGANGAWLYSPSGDYLTATVNSPLTSHSLPESGTYTIIAHRRPNKATPADYILHFVQVPGAIEYDPLISGNQRTGTLNSNGDLESYNFTANAGSDVVIGISGDGTNGSWVYSPSGVFLGAATSDTLNLDALAESGTYTVVAHRRPNKTTPADYALDFHSSEELMQVTQAVFQEGSGAVKLVYQRKTAIILDKGAPNYNDTNEPVINFGGSQIFPGSPSVWDIGDIVETPSHKIFYCNQNNNYCSLEKNESYSVAINNGVSVIPLVGVDVKETNMLELFFYGILNVSCSQNLCGFQNILEDEVRETNRFIARVFPLSDSGLFSVPNINSDALGNSFRGYQTGNEQGEFAYDLSNIQSADDQIRADVRMVAQKRASNAIQFQRGVGFVQDGYFLEKTNIWPNSGIPSNAKGVTYGGIKASLIELSAGSNSIAHELGHSFRQRLPIADGGPGEEYLEDPAGVGLKTSGFDIYSSPPNFKDINVTYNYMAADGLSEDRYWVNSFTWNATLNELSKQADDPEVIHITIDIYNNGLIKTYNWFEATGYPDVSSSGSYTLEIRSKDGTSLYEYNFTPSFRAIYEPGGAVPTNASPLYILADYPSNAEILMLKNDTGETIYTEDILAKSINTFSKNLTMLCQLPTQELDQLINLFTNLEQAVRDEIFLGAQNDIQNIQSMLQDFSGSTCGSRGLFNSTDNAQIFLSLIEDRIQIRLQTQYVMDADSDGMPDVWEIFYGLNPNSDTDAILDSDNDGKTNLDEFHDGTNPLIANNENGFSVPMMPIMFLSFLGILLGYFSFKHLPKKH